MTNIQPLTSIEPYDVLSTGIVSLKRTKSLWRDFETDEILITYHEIEDNFNYPSLSELRKEFEKSGSYTSSQIDKIMETYGRLPKYNTKSNRTSRSRKRSK